MTWWIYALASAVMAAFTAILLKAGVRDTPPLVATALRTAFVVPLVFAAAGWDIARGWRPSHIPWLLFAATGLTNALSWIFYTQAMTHGKASLVNAVDKASLPLTAILAIFLLHESLAPKDWLGIALIVAGILVLIR